MHLPRFEHISPSSIDEAVRILGEHGPQGRLVSGGSDLFPRMKYGLAQPDVVISLKNLPVRDPAVDDNGDLHLDALMTLADLVRSPVVRERAPLLTEAAVAVGSNEIRHMGTLGGNLCQESRCLYYNQTHTYQFVAPCFKRGGERCYLIPEGKKCWAVFCSDTAPALISLGARVEILGPEKSREISLDRLYTGDSLCVLDITGDEIVRSVIIPAQTCRRGSAFFKFSLRGGMEYAALNLAVVLDVESDGVLCREARITVGAVSSSPLRMTGAEEEMGGQPLSGDLFRQVAKTVASEAHPYPHHGFSAAYLRECLRVHTLRALTAASERIDKEDN
ncbi:MAG: FAD binding domain-containing protein [Deltaproteobacteria bacterium]|nr:FAD binding domain-containing protein [Deltaproteobacteria bacterium]